MKYLYLLLAVIVTSCNVTETIVFDQNMGGTYKTEFNLTPMMQMVAENRPQSVQEEKEQEEDVDSLIVFDDLIEANKAEVSKLSPEDKAKLEKLKGVTLRIKKIEAEHVFEFEIGKQFDNFSGLENIHEQLDGAFDFLKEEETKGKPDTGMNNQLKTDPVQYTFKNNSFKRFDPSKIPSAENTEEPSEEEDPMMEQMMQQFEQMFANSYYTVRYKFPKKIKSISSEDAVISKDGKEMVLKVDWNTINKDNTVLDLEVELED
ncbi:MAG: hypothetical protein HRT68_15950 [Flavobacteriaceae bacterium]|nr:hypothetical protein [Flavobacteriaceae bacterium]